MGEFARFEQDVADLGATIHFAALRPEVRAVAPHLSQWKEIEAAGRVHPTAFAAVRAYRATHPAGGEARDRDAD